MNEEELKEKVIRLEEQLKGAEKALNLAQNNTHSVVAQILSLAALVVSMYAIFHK